MSDYTGALEAVDRIVNRESEADEVLRQTVEVLHDRFDHYSWVGIYFVEERDLVLGPWKGPQATDHGRIPIGQGVCGAAAASGQTEVVDDVNADDRYLACFPSTRSEIVVPIVYEGKVVGEIDMDELVKIRLASPSAIRSAVWIRSRTVGPSSCFARSPYAGWSQSS